MRLQPFLLACAMAAPGAATATCGERLTLAAHAGTELAYALAQPPAGMPLRGAVLLLVGGDGHLKLDAGGCPAALVGNFLVRTASRFRDAGYVTALVDAPSDHQGLDGLGGFRTAEAHAQDLGRVVSELRTRLNLPVWVVGTSRGSISAANVASRTSGVAAPDGVMLTSAVTRGTSGYRSWTLQTVFDLPLASIRMPALVVGHANDACMRTPPDEMPRLLKALGSTRKQMFRVEGGPPPAATSLAGCEGRSAHGFVGQEAEVMEAMLRFVQQ